MFREPKTTNLPKPSNEIAVMVGGPCDGTSGPLVAEVFSITWNQNGIRSAKYLRTEKHDEHGRRIYRFSELRNGS
jgi:hypothetical protein